MTPLALLILVFTAFATASAVVLCRAAFRKPRIGALVERAVVAAVIAFFGVICSVLVVNTDGRQLILSREQASLLFRASLLFLLGIPTFWSFLYLTGRLGSPACAVQTAALGRCAIAGASFVRLATEGGLDLVLPLCPTHAGMLEAVR